MHGTPVLRNRREACTDLEGEDARPVVAAGEADGEGEEARLRLGEEAGGVGAALGAGAEALDAAELVEGGPPGARPPRTRRPRRRRLRQLHAPQRLQQQGDALRRRRGELLHEAAAESDRYGRHVNFHYRSEWALISDYREAAYIAKVLHVTNKKVPAFQVMDFDETW